MGRVIPEVDSGITLPKNSLLLQEKHGITNIKTAVIWYKPVPIAPVSLGLGFKNPTKED
ncbi:phosphoribosyltransferase [Microcystis aeruginosa NIES-44]|jgi:hypothetical protein|uniref:Phosphoribosyltransferase n=1 Tax=Microcystis aeruginosa NIES-44 TaxID=449439 RepID=A0A0A1VNL4_MICAE|nr:phosphoribosyltransferase [Microcystis aeruginosa NIES-44]